VALAARVVKQGLSVRATERLAAGRKPPRPGHAVPAPVANDPNLDALEVQIAEQIGMPVALAMNGTGTGSLTIRFESLDQLDWLCAKLN
jgi:ParB family chromosome partitioning protein